MRQGIATEAGIPKTIAIAAAVVTELVDALTVDELVQLGEDVVGGSRAVGRSGGPAGRWPRAGPERVRPVGPPGGGHGRRRPQQSGRG